MGRANKVLSVAVGFKHGEDIGFIKTRDALKCGDRRTHLAALQGTEKTDGNFCGASDLSERQPTFDTQAAEALAGRLQSSGGSGDDTLFFEDVYNRGRIKAASATQKESALQQANIGLRIHAVAACRASRRDEAEGFPGAQSRGRNAQSACDIGDAQEALSRQRIRCCGQILSA